MPSREHVDHPPVTSETTSNTDHSSPPVRALLEAASAALRSYQFGNADPYLAKRVADEIKVKTGWGY